jgi:hypothetical protein
VTLGELIAFLKTQDPNGVPDVGFGSPHSWRGRYDELSFEPTECVSFGEMLASAESALGQTFCGWKGGDFTMYEHTEVHLSYRGQIKDHWPTVALYLMCQTAPAENTTFTFDNFTAEHL